ncbi:glycosyltransferase family 4 protein [Geomonas sp. Red69]|uniref:glycosyltransferase family 4 protein n=1 Tax=Geomonas diazotrophica TaxID=2843197 RepID=UPI001C1295A3|nr:glycosyltransferase family 4 protein [Geomonas diazotrophica]MBU5638182.1 glycosyltransferase family 4 protein [Geomonas diazotrophica]
MNNAVPTTGASQHAPPNAPGLILMTADPIGGVWNYALELSRGLAPHGVRIALATMGRPLSPGQRREVADEANVTLFESGYRLEWMDDPWADVEMSGDWLLSLEAELKPDLVHLNGYVHAALPWRTPCLVVAHSCVLSWWEAVRGEQAPQRLEGYRVRVARGLAAADLVAAPSSAMLECIRRLYLPLPDAQVVYNARGRTRFRPGRKEDFILSVGRVWDEAKNIGALVRNAYDLPWPVYVAGEINQPGGGAANVDGVNRLGFLEPESLAPWYTAAAIYVLPARYEPFGLTVLEAALSGCALVLGDIPSLRELWDGAALFVDPESALELQKQLCALCADRNRQASLREKALERSRSFSAARMTAGYLSLYARLCGTTPPEVR